MRLDVQMPIWGLEYLMLPVTKLSAHHQSVGVCPAIVAHRPPLTTVKHF